MPCFASSATGLFHLQESWISWWWKSLWRPQCVWCIELLEVWWDIGCCARWFSIPFWGWRNRLSTKGETCVSSRIQRSCQKCFRGCFNSAYLMICAVPFFYKKFIATRSQIIVHLAVSFFSRQRFYVLIEISNFHMHLHVFQHIQHALVLLTWIRVTHAFSPYISL